MHTCRVVGGLHTNIRKRENNKTKAEQSRSTVVPGAVAFPLNQNAANLMKEEWWCAIKIKSAAVGATLSDVVARVLTITGISLQLLKMTCVG